MIVIEGPDCAGKTTFCNKLLKELPAHIYSHFTKLPPAFDMYWGYAERMSRYIVQDRFHMSEILYEQARNAEYSENGTRFTYEGYRLVDARLRQLGGVTVVITAAAYLIEERWKPDQMFSLKQTLEVGRLYDEAAHFKQLMFKEVDKKYIGYGSGTAMPVDVDIIIQCTRERPYPDESDVARILTLYGTRQRELAKVLARVYQPGGI